MRRVLHITNYMNKGGGTEAARLFSDDSDCFLYLERSRRNCVLVNQVYYLSLIKILYWAILNRHKFDVIHSHGRFPGFVYSILLRIPLRRKFFIHSFHGISSFNPGIKQSILKLVETLLSRFTNLIFYSSEFEKKNTKLRLFCESVILENGVLDSKISKSVAKNSSKMFHLGFSGSFSFPKEHEKLVWLVFKFNQRFDENKIKLSLCGDGSKRSAVDQLGFKLLGNQYESLGQIDDMRKFYEQIDGYIHYSQYESFGISIVEAFANKIPVLLNEGLPFSNLDNFCLTFPNHSTIKQLEVLKSFIYDEDGRKRRQKNAFALYEQKYSESIVFNKYRNFIDAL